jgi:hypothetical protein
MEGGKRQGGREKGERDGGRERDGEIERKGRIEGCEELRLDPNYEL